MKWLSTMRLTLYVGVLFCITPCIGLAQVGNSGPIHDAQRVVASQQAQSRLRPIGSPSAVDAYQPTRYPVRQVAMMQVNGDRQLMPAPALQPNGFGMPNTPLSQGQGVYPQNSAPPNVYAVPQPGALPSPLQSAPIGPIGPNAPPRTTIPPVTQPPFVQSQPTPRNLPQPALPFNPNVAPAQSYPSGPTYGRATQPVPRTVYPQGTTATNDYVAMPPPQLNNSFATMDNCRNISGPSTYRAAGVFGCGVPAYGTPAYGPPTYLAPAAYAPPPAQIAPAIALPPSGNYLPIGATGTIPPVLPGSSGYRPLFSFGQETKPVQVGQGIVGQPVAYVPGQVIRNALRYISF